MAGEPIELASYPSQLDRHAASHPDDVAVTVLGGGLAEETITWAALRDRSLRAAHGLAARGVGDTSFVVIGLPNGIDHVASALGALRLGACVLPISPALPGAELEQLIALVREHAPTVVIGSDLGPTALSDPALPSTPIDDVVSAPGIAIASGGSTGRPKIVLNALPFCAPRDVVPGLAGMVGLRHGQTQLISGPMYHTGPFGYAHLGLFHGHHLVVLRRFEAPLALAAIEDHGVQFAFMVPTMLSRLHRAVEERESAGQHVELSSLEMLWSAAAPCPPWVLRAWIDRLGPTRVAEAYGSSEGVGGAFVTGTEWLAKPGTVGKPLDCDVRIMGADGEALATGEVGEVFLRRTDETAPTFTYLGGPPAPRTGDGFTSIGDLGHLDADGYLFLDDRRHDLIICGGANVYPAEVEAAISEHPLVVDVAVIGLAHHDLGKVPHAIVELVAEADAGALEVVARWTRARISAVKAPRTYERIDALPRTEAGKIRRSALAAARASGAG